MGKAEIIAQLKQLSAEERAEVQAKLDELAADAWQDRGELSDAERKSLDAALAAYEKSPGAGSSWEQAKARIQGKLHPDRAAMPRGHSRRS
jgi:putative addiction module component (TIGR02574 family)